MKPLIIVSAVGAAVGLAYLDHELVGMFLAYIILVGGNDLTKGDKK